MWPAFCLDYLLTCAYVAQRILTKMLRRTSRNLSPWVDAGLLRLSRSSFSVSSQAAVDMASKEDELRVFIVAGEVSGDTIGSRLMVSLKKLSPFPIRFGGVGG